MMPAVVVFHWNQSIVMSFSNKHNNVKNKNVCSSGFLQEEKKPDFKQQLIKAFGQQVKDYLKSL